MFVALSFRRCLRCDKSGILVVSDYKATSRAPLGATYLFSSVPLLAELGNCFIFLSTLVRLLTEPFARSFESYKHSAPHGAVRVEPNCQASLQCFLSPGYSNKLKKDTPDIRAWTSTLAV